MAAQGTINKIMVLSHLVVLATTLWLLWWPMRHVEGCFFIGVAIRTATAFDGIRNLHSLCLRWGPRVGRALLVHRRELGCDECGRARRDADGRTGSGPPSSIWEPMPSSGVVTEFLARPEARDVVASSGGTRPKPITGTQTYPSDFVGNLLLISVFLGVQRGFKTSPVPLIWIAQF